MSSLGRLSSSKNPTFYAVVEAIHGPPEERWMRDYDQTQLRHVYFVLDAERAEIKIGYSANVARRLQALRLERGPALELLGTTQGGRTFENLLHKRFAPYRRSGREWFSTEIVAEVAELLA